MVALVSLFWLYSSQAQLIFESSNMAGLDTQGEWLFAVTESYTLYKFEGDHLRKTQTITHFKERNSVGMKTRFLITATSKHLIVYDYSSDIRLYDFDLNLKKKLKIKGLYGFKKSSQNLLFSMREKSDTPNRDLVIYDLNDEGMIYAQELPIRGQLSKLLKWEGVFYPTVLKSGYGSKIVWPLGERFQRVKGNLALVRILEENILSGIFNYKNELYFLKLFQLEKGYEIFLFKANLENGNHQKIKKIGQMPWSAVVLGDELYYLDDKGIYATSLIE